MVLEVTFNVGGDVISFSDNTTGGTFDGSVVVVHPDGFTQTVAITNANPTGSVDFRTDSDGNILEGAYSFAYTNDADVDETTNIDFHYTAPTIDLDCKVDYLCSKLTITDKTSYNLPSVSSTNTTIVRDLTASYPSAAELADITSNTIITVVNPIYTGTFGLVFEATLTWDFGTYTVTDILKSNKECKVDEGDSLCSLTCCMKESFKRWNNARCVNDRRSSAYEEQFRRVTSIATLAYVALSCGDTKGVESYVAEAKKIAGCDECDCGDGGSGKLVVGLCGASSTGGVDVFGSDSINITSGGVISVNETWLDTFVDNIIAALNLGTLSTQVSTNTTNIANITQLLADVGIDNTVNIGELETQVAELVEKNSNHHILSFSYRFDWASGVLVDNRDAQSKVLDGNVTIMNGFGLAGWFDRPKVTWVNAASSNERATIEVELFGIESLPPVVPFNNLNVACEMSYASQDGVGDGKVKPVVMRIGSNGENDVLKYRVQFYHEDIGYVTQSWLSINSDLVLGGSPHLTFFVTGKN